MKLLFDENLSPRLVGMLSNEFPGSVHVREIGLAAAPDPLVWQFARANQFVIVSKDADFRQRSILFGAPPKVIGLLVGNSSTTRVEVVIRASLEAILRFEQDPQAAFLELP